MYSATLQGLTKTRFKRGVKAMTQRDRLIELICEITQDDLCLAHCNFPPCNIVKQKTDYLIANGVVVLPCKREDK